MPNISDLNFSVPSFNFSYMQQNLIPMMIQGYERVLGHFIWAFIFSAIIGYIVVKNKSTTAGAVAILLIFGAFGSTSVFLQMSAFTMFMQLIFALSITGIVVVYFMRRRR